MLRRFSLLAKPNSADDQRAHTNRARYCHIVGGPRYSVLRNSAMAMASIAAPMTATMARDSPSGTTQPNHVMPGLRVCTASGLTARWPHTAERIGPAVEGSGAKP